MDTGIRFDFSTILFLAVVITGMIWLIDARLFRPKRLANINDDEVPAVPVIAEYAKSFFPIILIVLLLRSFLVEPFKIPSGSMMPTLLIGDLILVNKFAYGIRLPVINKKIIEIGEPKRGDVVVFRYPQDPSVDYIKRLVGLPGDRITYRGKRLLINGEPLQYEAISTYIGSGSGVNMTGNKLLQENLGGVDHQILVEPSPYEHQYTCMQNNEFVVPPGEYFMMGDNRDHSNDSRFWCTVPEGHLVGRAFMIWMHWDDGVNWKRIGDDIK